MRGLKQMENDNESFFEQSFKKKYSKEEIKCRELLKVLYIEWRKTKNEELFLVLLAYTWLFTENAYLDDTFKFYNDKIYEKELLLELLLYGEKYMIKSIKFLVLSGYIYSTTGYYFWGNIKFGNEEIEEKGEMIIIDLHTKYPKHFMIGYFYGMLFGFEKMYKYFGEKRFKEKVCTLFPSRAEIDIYFRENGN